MCCFYNNIHQNHQHPNGWWNHLLVGAVPESSVLTREIPHFTFLPPHLHQPIFRRRGFVLTARRGNRKVIGAVNFGVIWYERVLQAKIFHLSLLISPFQCWQELYFVRYTISRWGKGGCKKAFNFPKVSFSKYLCKNLTYAFIHAVTNWFSAENFSTSRWCFLC